MAVNNNFYATLNQLMGTLNSGFAVVDYDSFVDSGKVLSSMSYTDLVNGFLTPLMNKVQKTIMDVPSYKGALVDMYFGRLDYGVLEMILLDNFYDMDASTFDGSATLVNGQTYTDQFRVSIPDIVSKYYTQTNSYEFTITIRDTDLRGSFTSPEKMDRFIAGIFNQVTNSIEFTKETSRLGILAKALNVAYAATAEVADETTVAQHYGLVTIYNTLYGTTLTATTALQDPVFVRFAVATIRDIAHLMEKPLKNFNNQAFQTFTEPGYRRIKINSIFDKAIRMSMISAFNKEDAALGLDHEILPYWQAAKDPAQPMPRLSIETAQTGSTSAPSEPIIACLYDKRAMGEMVQLEDVTSTRNEKRRYTNYHWLLNKMYWYNDHANFVIFTLE